MYKKTEFKDYKEFDPDYIVWEKTYGKSTDKPIVYDFPKTNGDFKQKKYFIVKEDEKALFYRKAKLISAELSKKRKNIEFKIIWIDISIINIDWGIPHINGIPIKEGYKIGLHGNLKISINHVKTFYEKIIKKEHISKIGQLKTWITKIIAKSLRVFFGQYSVKNIPIVEQEKIIKQVKKKISRDFKKVGLILNNFNILGMKLPESTNQVVKSQKTKEKVLFNIDEKILKDLLEEKQNLLERIKELKHKIKNLQDLLLEDKINKQNYEKKKDQIEEFIHEVENELISIDEKIKEKTQN